MKKILIITITAILSVNTFGQILNKEPREIDRDEDISTIFRNNSSYGGYGGIYINYTQIDNVDAVEIGGRGSFIIAHSLALGIEGAGFISDVIDPDGINQDDYIYSGGYGGFTIEPIIFPKFPVHLSFPVLLGAGAVTYCNVSQEYSDEYYVDDIDVFMLARPGVELEFNITRYFRISINGYYRFTTDILNDTEFLKTSDGMNGFSVGMGFKFGKF